MTFEEYMREHDMKITHRNVAEYLAAANVSVGLGIALTMRKGQHSIHDVRTAAGPVSGVLKGIAFIGGYKPALCIVHPEMPLVRNRPAETTLLVEDILSIATNPSQAAA